MFYFKPLIRKFIDDQAQVKKLEKTESDKEVMMYLMNLGVQREDMQEVFEKHYGMECIDLKKQNIHFDDIKGFDLTALKKAVVIPYDLDNNTKVHRFAISDMMNEGLKKEIRSKCRALGTKAEFSFAFDFEIIERINNLQSVVVNPEEDIEADGFDAENWVNAIVMDGIKKNASDIHIESLETGIQVRFRIDGILTNKKIYVYDSGIISTIVARIKIISGMDISEKRKPQDGRMSDFIYKNNQYDLRVSSVKTILGEKVVLRIFNKTGRVLSFEEIGFSKEDTANMIRLLKSRSGIIYMAGATGSGKTTSLYTMVDTINTDDVNIYTIEDPVEKTIKNVNQIQIDPLAGIDYLNTLRALLRQDPDVIVVGEIRDAETADLSMRASLTGHLVLSTIHANNAIDSISRLMDMGIEPYLLGASSVAFLSQRLVRTLCPHCKRKKNALTDEEKAWVQFKQKDFGVELKTDIDIYEPVGCSHCNGGYIGRTAVIELLEVTDNTRDMIKQGASNREIRDSAVEGGYRPLIIEGFNLIENGTTSISEIMKQL